MGSVLRRSAETSTMVMLDVLRPRNKWTPSQRTGEKEPPVTEGPLFFSQRSGVIVEKGQTLAEQKARTYFPW